MYVLFRARALFIHFIWGVVLHPAPKTICILVAEISEY